ncbi:hypothetical protein DNI29_16870 [Hymenobacter sediminis]|uniref:hypothetical protein n=1 Tax=Hymenobacter sediminis TaxID=2218621 RepID=UPI000DA6CD3A|nr:hypothetical protein [Hymenobacter sediminis]RPD45822.1 hypothetical protein DNI29_16870 [Hymenobacter sediminis]
MTHAEIVAYLETQANINYNAPFPQAHLFLMPSRLKGSSITTQEAMCFYGKDEHENGSDDRYWQSALR